MASTASTTYKDYIEGKLVTAIGTGTTTGITVRIKQVNGSTPTWPTAIHRLKIVQKTATNNKVEKLEIAAGTSQSGQTVTLGTATRALSLTDGTNFSGSVGTAQSFTAGADVFIAWDNHDAAQTAKLDIANTFAAKQTFNVPPRKAVYATAGDLPSGGNGDEGAYVTADGVFYDYIAGAWSQRATGTTPNGSTTVAGKFEESTVAEQGSATATGATGARLIPSVANLVKTSSGAGDENKIAVLNSSGTYNIGFIATGTPTGTKFVRDDGTLVVPTSTNYVKPVYLGASDSGAIGSGSTSTLDFDTHTFTIPANDLVSGVAYEFVGIIYYTWAAGNADIYVTVGTTNMAFGRHTPINADYIAFRGTIRGTAAAGASVAVRTEISIDGYTVAGKTVSGYATANLATNGTLAIKISHAFGTSNGSNTATLVGLTIKKISTTAF